MVKAAGFEPRIVQLRVRNLTDSANSFQETHRHLKCTSKLTPWLPRWPPYCKMTDLHLDHFLYLLHSCTLSYQSRCLSLAHATKMYGDIFYYTTVRGHIRTLPNFTTAFLFPNSRAFTHFLLQDCTGAHYQTARRSDFEFWGLLPISWLPDCRGQPPWWWQLFSQSKTDPFQ